MNEERYLEIRVDVLDTNTDGMNVNMKTECKNMTSREVAHCLAEAVNDILNTESEQARIPLSYLRLRFIECLIQE